jgi:hypothetical protein
VTDGGVDDLLEEEEFVEDESEEREKEEFRLKDKRESKRLKRKE